MPKTLIKRQDYCPLLILGRRFYKTYVKWPGQGPAPIPHCCPSKEMLLLMILALVRLSNRKRRACPGCRLPGKREDWGLPAWILQSFLGTLLAELPAVLRCVDKPALGFSNRATVTLTSRSLFVRARSASLGTDSSQPREAQPQTLGLAKQQLFQKPIVGGCCLAATSPCLSALPSGCFRPERESQGNGLGRPEPAFTAQGPAPPRPGGGRVRVWGTCLLALFSAACLFSPGQTPSEETKGPIDPIAL